LETHAMTIQNRMAEAKGVITAMTAPRPGADNHQRSD
jgi:hypothetical protein